MNANGEGWGGGGCKVRGWHQPEHAKQKGGWPTHMILARVQNHICTFRTRSVRVCDGVAVGMGFARTALTLKEQLLIADNDDKSWTHKIPSAHTKVERNASVQ